MMPQQQQNQNLPAVSQSLLQQTGSGAHVKPFSTRVELCLKHGLKEVLPPFGRQSSLAEPLKGCSSLMHSPNHNNNDNKEADSGKLAQVPHLIEEGNQHNISTNLSQSADTSLKAVKEKDKRIRRRGRCKKRSMVDILASAENCTLEEIHRMNNFSNAETVIDECQRTVPYENISNKIDDDSCRKAASEDDGHGVTNVPVDMAASAKRPLLKFKLKLNGYVL